MYRYRTLHWASLGRKVGKECHDLLQRKKLTYLGKAVSHFPIGEGEYKSLNNSSKKNRKNPSELLYFYNYY